MSSFEVITLGCGSAKPSLNHNPSSTVVRHRGSLYMIDCGEGAQKAFMAQRLPFSRLRHIFLTHLHGDHVFGLPGLVGTLALSDIGGDLTIHTFQEGADILDNIFRYFCADTPFKLNFNVITPEEKIILETKSLSVRTIPLHHRIPAVGFVFEEKPKERHINPDMTRFYQVPFSWMNRLKAGEDFITPDGSTVPNHILTTAPSPSLSYAHISDTAYMPHLAEKIGPVDLLFHETTYLDDLEIKAKQRGHSTASQAARVARDAGAKRLLTGHYSSRYNNDAPFLEEASKIFPDVILNREGLVIPLD